MRPLKTHPTPKIEKGIALPTSRGRSEKWIALIQSMGVGDSFVVDLTQAQLVRQSFSHFKKRLKTKIRITGRTRPDGVRFWRIE